jgi:hypothetical protein
MAGQPGGSNYKAQNNTQSIITDQDTISRFTAELIAEHMSARAVVSDPAFKSQQLVPVGTPRKTTLQPPTQTPAKKAAKKATKKVAKKAPAKKAAKKS